MRQNKAPADAKILSRRPNHPAYKREASSRGMVTKAPLASIKAGLQIRAYICVLENFELKPKLIRSFSIRTTSQL